MLLFISAVKLITEIALLAMFGQWCWACWLGIEKSKCVLPGAAASGLPFVKLARFVTPKLVLERHLPLVAFLILAFVWIGVTFAKINHCLKIGVALCQ
jgi:hypothetical protein